MSTPLPPGYVQRTCGRRTVVVAEELGPAIEALGFVGGAPRVAAEGTATGRIAHPVLRLPEDGRRVLWKRCGRGGWIEPILKDLHLGTDRFLRELALTERARLAGVPVARILALAFHPAGAGWQRAELLSEIVEGARDGAAALTLPDVSRRRALVLAAARELRRFHGLGFLHGDLNVRNLLWREEAGQPRITFIDLDPARAPAPSRPTAPLANLLRLARSVERGEREGRWQLSSTDRYRFLREYFRGDRPGLCEFWARAARQRRRRRAVARLRPTPRASDPPRHGEAHPS